MARFDATPPKISQGPRAANSEAVTVACVFWQGSFRDRRYKPEWVTRLRAMVARNLSLPHRFVCLSNVDVPGVDVIPLRHDWPGWWSKIELFHRREFDGGRWLYVDLDVLVVASLDEVVTYPAPLALAPCIVTTPKARMVRRYQSSLMAWSPPAGREIYDEFDPQRHTAEFYGDQDWIGHVKPECATFPREWVCKFASYRPGSLAKVVLAQHPLGNDGAAEKHEWVRDLWIGRA